MPNAWKRRDMLRAGALAPAALAAPAAQLPDEVRVAILGFEGHTSEAVEVARRDKRVRIVAYETTSAREDARARSAKDVLTGARHYRDYRELLDREKLDAACICDINARRVESVVACLERGLPTAAEKPLGIAVGELERIRETAARTRTPLTMLLPMRFDPKFVAMKRAVERGAIGEPVNLSGQKSYQVNERPEWMTKRATFGGTIPYIACHTVDLLRFVSGRDMVAAAAFQGKVGFPETGEMENTAAISYALDNGGTACLRLDYLRPKAAGSHGDDRVRIAGTRGVIEYQNGRVSLVTDAEPERELADFPQTPKLFADFLEAVYTRREPLLTQAEIFRVTEIVLRSREAADTGTVVRI